VQFVYQAQAFGGRAQKGGLLPDFVVAHGAAGHAWQVQGEFWHSYGENQGKDIVTDVRLLGQTFGGLRVEQVIQVWENDIYHKRPMVFQMALMGVGLRG
jgi:hypothetical protein